MSGGADDVAATIRAPERARLVTPRVLATSAAAIGLGGLAGLVAQGLGRLIALITHLAYFGTWSAAPASPAENRLGLALSILVPVVGGLVVGVMARYGSEAIRGHGIPEAMERVLFDQSRIPPRVAVLKPLSAAIAIGTGGPFGAEGPIIATGGALGSIIGQWLPASADERKTLLAAGAAAGMAATFGSPVSAVLLAIELLLFEYRARSIIPVALASVTGTAVRMQFVGGECLFPMGTVAAPGAEALAAYGALGLVLGLFAVLVTRAVYAVEDGFALLPIHWMWWPALGGVAVGLIGRLEPHTLGVGYDNLGRLLAGQLAGGGAAALAVAKLASWAIALGTGTSGGTLAPLFTIGGGLGAGLAAAVPHVVPGLVLDSRVAALVGMAAMFAGASRALLASVVFAFEITQQPMGLLPILAGASGAFLVSCFLMPHSIMTEKIARRGVRVRGEYAVDFFERLLVRDVAARPVVTLDAARTLEDVRAWIASRVPEARHQGFPVLAGGRLAGVLTRRDLLDPATPGHTAVGALVRRAAAVAYETSTLREAADLMVRENIGRLPVVSRSRPDVVTGMITRSDLLAAHRRRLAEGTPPPRRRVARRRRVRAGAVATPSP
jgi:chloride channel protein, CIC family